MTRLLPRRSDLRAVRRAPLRDLLAGTTVALVALPLALAFGVASGAGAHAGLVTAIVAGAVAAVFGGSNLQVSGPTGAMTVVLVPVFHRFGVDGVLTVGLLAGGLLVVAAYARLGRFVRYLPIPVVEGFTAGIAVVIALQQLPAALGVSAHGDRVWALGLDAVERFVRAPTAAPALVALGVAAAILLAGRLHARVPFSLVAVAAATGIAEALSLHLPRIGALPAPLEAPSVSFLDLQELRSLLPSALAVAALGALESLLSATVADGMTVNQRHDPDRELFGQGLANLAVPFFGGVPATGAIARTAVNVRAGAGSRLAALVHALVLALLVLAAAPLVALIPLAALAGVLLATCVRMIEAASLLAVARSTRRDALVLALTFGVTVAVDLVTAVVIGLAAALVLAVRAIAHAARLDEVPLDEGDHSEQERALFAEHIVAYRFEGPLFFAAAHRFLQELVAVADVRVVVLRMSRVSTIDATGAHVLADAVGHLERRGIAVLLSGVAPRHRELLGALDPERVFADTPAAIEAARRLAVAPAAAA